MIPFPRIWRTGQLLALAVGLIGIVGLSVPLALEGLAIAAVMEWIWRHKRHWFGLRGQDDE